MVVYAIGSAGLAWLVKPILDKVLPNQESLALTAWAIVAVYLLKGIGSYVSAYLMTELGQRVGRTTRRSQEAQEHLSHLSVEAFTGHRIVKAFGTEKIEADKFSRAA